MIDYNIAILGGGHLGSSLAAGLLRSKQIKPSALHVTRRRIELLDSLKQQGVRVTSDNLEACRQSGVVLLAVKPYQAISLIEEVRPALGGKILVSMATGVELQKIEQAAGPGAFVFRAMPNTAVAIQQSMTLISTSVTDEAKRCQVVDLFNVLGKTAFITEDLMAAATVLASCGIAFALRYIRAAMQGGVEIGFDAEMSQFITAQTVQGATGLLLESGQHPEHEIDKVTTPRGITITGLNEMEHQGFSSSLIQGLVASFKKIATP